MQILLVSPFVVSILALIIAKPLLGLNKNGSDYYNR